MNYLDDILAERINSKDGNISETFKFEKIKRKKREVKNKYPNINIIDMGVGEPDDRADDEVIEVLNKEAKKMKNRTYADNGIIDFKIEAINYLKKIYGVHGLDYNKNIIHGIGSKSILAMLPLCLINPGDVSIVTTPGYPIIATHTYYLGGEVFELPLDERNNYLPNLDLVPKDILKRAKILYLNYPNNPTGAVANKEFFKKAVDFAKINNILVIHDAAYAAITYDENKPLSFLSIDGAIDVGVEVHSLSKAFNMTGWRLAFIAGNEKIINAFGNVKDNMDSGQFKAIQKAGIKALRKTEITQNACKRYSRRLDLLVDALNEVGFTARKPKGSFYCYVKSPIGANKILFKNAEEAADYIIENAMISTVPWDEVGHYLRFSVTFESGNQKEEDVISEMKRRLLSLNLKF